MDFNIYKYDKQIFHADELTHKRIKALLLWYEHQAYEKGLQKSSKLILIDDIINMCVKREWYEIAGFFKRHRIKIHNR